MENKIVRYMKSDAVLANFADVLGHGANAYVSSVLITVANDERLQQCTPASIYVAAMKAANAGLSVDAELGRAYLVAYKNHKTGNLEAQFQPSYRGLKQLAMETGKYRYINSGPVYEGENIVEDRISGLHRIDGQRTSDTVIGWIAAFELTNGYAKTLYMTVDEIHAHAQKHNPNGYNSSKGGWKKYQRGHKSNVMEQKTPMRLLLLRDGYLTPAQAAVIREGESEIVDATPMPDVPDTPEEPEVYQPPSEEQNMADLGYEPEPQHEPATLEEKLRRDAQYIRQAASTGQRQALIGMLEGITKGDRHLFGKHLYGKPSSKDWTGGEVLAVWRYLKVTQDPETQEWIPDVNSVQSLLELHLRAQEQDGQMALEGMK